MTYENRRTLKIVLAAHVGVILLLGSDSLLKRLLRPRQEVVVPVEFVVDTRPPMPDPADSLPEDVEPAPPQLPEPDVKIPEPAPPKPKPKLKPKPKPRRKRPKIEISHRRVGPPKSNPLTRKQIEKLLADGAKAGDHTVIPGEDARCMAAIKNTLYALWDQPPAADVGSAVAVMRLRLSGSGRVESAELYRKSGNPALDDSVRLVARSIRRIPGLTADFIRRHPSVTISFTVE